MIKGMTRLWFTTPVEVRGSSGLTPEELVQQHLARLAPGVLDNGEGFGIPWVYMPPCIQKSLVQPVFFKTYPICRAITNGFKILQSVVDPRSDIEGVCLLIEVNHFYL